jgi:hypothetical protein
MKIPKQMSEDLKKYNIFINSDGKQRFNSGRFLTDLEIEEIVAEYEKGGNVESYIKKRS